MQQFKINLIGKEDIVKIETYQTIDKMYEHDVEYDFSRYKYIVCDEFHYFTSDASFNNTTDMSINAILKQTDNIRIFMSATADLMHRYLNDHRKLKTIDYEIDIDYNFIDELYFYESIEAENTIIENIIGKNEKAIIFVNNLKRLEDIYLKYKDIAMFNCSKEVSQYKYVNEKKIIKMLANSKFEENLLLSTSVMDTGVSIKDEKVKHIICSNIVDVNVLIQSIGRKRMLHNTDKVNIYVKNINNNVLAGYKTQAKQRIERVKYLDEYGQYKYTKKYKKSREDKSIVYFDVDNNSIVAKKNEMAHFKTLMDIIELESMINVGYKQTVSAKLGKPYKTIDTIIHRQNLEEFLDNLVGTKLYNNKQKDILINKIDYKFNGVQYRSYKKLNEGLSNEGLPFVIIPKKSGGERYWTIEKFIE